MNEEIDQNAFMDDDQGKNNFSVFMLSGLVALVVLIILIVALETNWFLIHGVAAGALVLFYLDRKQNDEVDNRLGLLGIALVLLMLLGRDYMITRDYVESQENAKNIALQKGGLEANIQDLDKQFDDLIQTMIRLKNQLPKSTGAGISK